MKLSFLLFVLSIITLVSAFGTAGAYERLWYWYAYTMDTSGAKIAPGCRTSVSSSKPCSFAQFMKYIDMDPNAELLPNEIGKVDDTDVPRTIQALQNGRYTGPYDCSHIHADIEDPSDVAKLMQAITGFIEGKISSADAQRKINLQQVTLGVAKERAEAAIPGYTKALQDKFGITLRTSQTQIFDGSPDTCEFIDYRATAQASGKTQQEIKDAVLQIQQSDLNHVANIRWARRGAASVRDACIS